MPRSLGPALGPRGWEHECLSAEPGLSTIDAPTAPWRYLKSTESPVPVGAMNNLRGKRSAGRVGPVTMLFCLIDAKPFVSSTHHENQQELLETFFLNIPSVQVAGTSSSARKSDGARCTSPEVMMKRKRSGPLHGSRQTTGWGVRDQRSTALGGDMYPRRLWSEKEKQRCESF